MKFKLDENLGTTAVRAFEDAGHDTRPSTGRSSQELAGADDGRVFQVCRDEQRILVTLNLDFANPLTFAPRLTAGVSAKLSCCGHPHLPVCIHFVPRNLCPEPDRPDSRGREPSPFMHVSASTVAVIDSSASILWWPH